MEKDKLSATFVGECYINGYGRKLYKKGFLLENVRNENGEILFEKVKVTKNKSFENIDAGEVVTFLAEVKDKTLSDIRIISIDRNKEDI